MNKSERPDLLWHTTRVVFPEKLLYQQKGKTKEASPLTRKGNLSKRNKQFPVQFEINKNAKRIEVSYPTELRRSTREKKPTQKYNAYPYLSA